MSFRPRGEGFRPRFRGPPGGGFRGPHPRGFGRPRAPFAGGRPFPGPPLPRGAPPLRGAGGPPRFGPRGVRPPFRGPRPTKPQEVEDKVSIKEQKPGAKQEHANDPPKPKEETKVGQDVISLGPKEEESKERITLDEYHCDLHFQVEGNGLIGSTLHKDGFEYIWGGGKATHGVKAGRVCFEVEVLEELPVNMPGSEKTPHVLRVGWSVDGSGYQLGECDLSYGYGGTAKSSLKSKFSDYGRKYGQGDIIGCYVDLESSPKAIFFTVNGEYQGIAFKLGAEVEGKALYPHINGKNMKFGVNFGETWPKFPLTSGFKMIDASPKENLIKGPKAPEKSDAELIMMVGLPAAGKSYWAEDYAKKNPDKRYYILGTNNIIDKMKVMGLARKRNYHGRWDELIKQATACLNVWLKIAERKVRNYILDQTNVYFTARRRKMRSFQGYKRIAAVVINTPEVLKERTVKREREEGKMVPESAVMEMKLNFSLPEKGESFEDVLFIDEKLPKAKELVELYNKEGREFKLGGGGSNQGRGPPTKFARGDNSFDNRQPFSNPNARGGYYGGSPRGPYHGPRPSQGPRFGQDRTNQGFNQYGPRDGKPSGPRFGGPQTNARIPNARATFSEGNNYGRNQHEGYQQGKGGYRRNELNRNPPPHSREYFSEDQGWDSAAGGAIKQEPYDDSYGDQGASGHYSSGVNWGANRSNAGNDWNKAPYAKQEPQSYQIDSQNKYQGYGASGGGYQSGDYKSSSQPHSSGYDHSNSQNYSNSQDYPYNQSYPQASQGHTGGASQGYASGAPQGYASGASQGPAASASQGYGGTSSASYNQNTSYSQTSYGGSQGQGAQTNYYDQQGSNVYKDPVKQEVGSTYPQTTQYRSSERDYYSQGSNMNSQNVAVAYDQKSYASTASYYGQQGAYTQSGQNTSYGSNQSAPASSLPSQGANTQSQWQYGPQTTPAAPAQSYGTFGQQQTGYNQNSSNFNYSNYGYGS